MTGRVAAPFVRGKPVNRRLVPQVLLRHLQDVGHQRPGHECLPGGAVAAARQPVQQHVGPARDLLLYRQVQGRGEEDADEQLSSG